MTAGKMWQGWDGFTYHFAESSVQHSILGANEPKGKEVNTGLYLLKWHASRCSRLVMVSPWCPEVQQCKPGFIGGHMQQCEGRHAIAS